MKIKEFFQSVNKEDLDEIKNIDKELIDSDKESFDDYFVSTFLYKLKDGYYCYMAVSNKEESRSNLLNKRFKDLEKANVYYNELHILAISGDLYKIRGKLEK